MKTEGSRVLVTGAGGFIGSHLTEVLVQRGADVRALVHYNSRNDWGMLEELSESVRNDIDVIAGDVRDPLCVKSLAEGCEIVFHLASLIAIPYSYTAPSSYVGTNVQGTLNVMQACLENGVKKVVHTSTSEVYGTAQYTPIDEDHPIQAQSPYSASKIAADKIVESFHLSYELPVATVRPFNTFGPRQSARAVIPTIICQALSKDEIKLGLLSPVRDLTYVDDTVNGFIMTAECDEAVGQVINTGSGDGISIGELANVVMAVMGVEKKVVEDKGRYRPPKSEVMELICNNRKAREVLGWQPRNSLKDGIEKTIEFFRNNLHNYKPEVYNI
jgi:NAD dependent epimerase/dehydratase